MPEWMCTPHELAVAGSAPPEQAGSRPAKAISMVCVVTLVVTLTVPPTQSSPPYPG